MLAAALFACLSIVIVLTLPLSGESRWLWLAVVAIGMGLVLVYLLAYLILERTVFRRLRLIHSKLRELRSATGGDVNKSMDLISKLDHEVERWARDKGTEVTTLRDMEEFRREFVGNVAHELRTPIFSIQGYLDSLLESDLDDKHLTRHYLHKAFANAERLLAITNDLTTINMLESGRVQPDMALFDMRQLAGEVLESLEVQAKGNSIALSITADTPKAVWVRADRHMIRQALVNLLTNAIAYSKPSGGQVTVNISGDRDYVQVQVVDNGIGISPQDLPRIFERFYRADMSRSRHSGGTGLGLSIVKHIVEAHQQEIHVNSAPGQGSTFTFTLEPE